MLNKEHLASSPFQTPRGASWQAESILPIDTAADGIGGPPVGEVLSTESSRSNHRVFLAPLFRCTEDKKTMKT
jgi:hypothetical protein